MAFCTKLLPSLSVHIKESTNVGKSHTFHYAQSNLLKHTPISIKLPIEKDH